MHIIADRMEQKGMFEIFKRVMWRLLGYAIIYDEQEQNISNAMLEIWCKQDKNGCTPGHLLWATENSDMIKEAEFFIGAKANNTQEAIDTVMKIKDNEGRTPLDKPIKAPLDETKYGLTLCFKGSPPNVKKVSIIEESKDGPSSKPRSYMNQVESRVTKTRNDQGMICPLKNLWKQHYRAYL
ncbi:hypothetical protein RLOatenuis_5820 [Rickettsiales bacterium]|nr:hypothetical protein RLOatenuis_5820 [Rickettsiales bacterium]